jgi:hypothetical protein
MLNANTGGSVASQRFLATELSKSAHAQISSRVAAKGI